MTANQQRRSANLHARPRLFCLYDQVHTLVIERVETLDLVLATSATTRRLGPTAHEFRRKKGIHGRAEKAELTEWREGGALFAFQNGGIFLSGNPDSWYPASSASREREIRHHAAQSKKFLLGEATRSTLGFALRQAADPTQDLVIAMSDDSRQSG
jgi:hypothetical protein